MTETAATSSTRRVSLFHLALLVPWVALVIDAFMPIVDNSFLWHIRAGSTQTETTAVLTSDPFSLVLSGEQWITQSWLVELLYAWAEDRFAFGYVAPMMLVASTLTVAGIGVIAYRRSTSVAATAITVYLTTILLLRFTVPRPVLFSYPLLVLVILAWYRKSARWTLPFLFWIWASVHASFVIGLVYIGLSIVSKRDWRAIRVAVAAGLATLLTAHGLSVVTMLIDFAQSRPYLDFITEWRTPDFLEVALLPVLIGLLVMLYGGMMGRLDPTVLWIIGPFLVLTMSATRAVATGWIVLAPFVAQSLAGLEVRRFRGYPTKLAVGVAMAIGILPFAFIKPVDVDPERFPVEAAEWLDDVPTFHDDVSGGYLIWSRIPTGGVFIDDRVELYQERIEEFVEVRAGRKPWEPVFDRDGIVQVLLKSGEPLVTDLKNAGWPTTYSDARFVVMVASS